MILTPIASGQLIPTLARFTVSLSSDIARSVFDRLNRVADAKHATGQKAVKNHAESIVLATIFGMDTKTGKPQLDVAWDGRALRTETEAYVLLHEIAHFQLAAPARRIRVEFGLGPGPETGDRVRAERAQTLFGLAREREEAMASLLGILWEAELNQPALASLLDQNWLEGAGRPSVAEHFAAVLGALQAGGFVDRIGRPRMQLRRNDD